MFNEQYSILLKKHYLKLVDEKVDIGLFPLELKSFLGNIIHAHYRYCWAVYKEQCYQKNLDLFNTINLDFNNYHMDGKLIKYIVLWKAKLESTIVVKFKDYGGNVNSGSSSGVYRILKSIKKC